MFGFAVHVRADVGLPVSQRTRTHDESAAARVVVLHDSPPPSPQAGAAATPAVAASPFARLLFSPARSDGRLAPNELFCSACNAPAPLKSNSTTLLRKHGACPSGKSGNRTPFRNSASR